MEAHAVASLNGIASSESAAVLSADGLHVYFATSRATTATKGREDIWVATRKTPTSEWGDLRPLPELNSAGYDSPSWLSDDECTLLFVSNRRQANLATTFWDVYVAERTRQ